MRRAARRGRSLLIFTVALALGAAFIVLTSRSMPEVLASNFDATGVAHASMPRNVYVAIMAGVGIVVPAIVVYLPALLYRIPGVRFRLPNRDHWLAPERREQTIATLVSFSSGYGILLVIFLCFVHWQVVRANATPPPSLPLGMFLGGMMAFMVVTIGAAFTLVSKFTRVPRA